MSGLWAWPTRLGPRVHESRARSGPEPRAGGLRGRAPPSPHEPGGSEAAKRGGGRGTRGWEGGGRGRLCGAEAGTGIWVTRARRGGVRAVASWGRVRRRAVPGGSGCLGTGAGACEPARLRRPSRNCQMNE